jgi:hypothetical protein
MWRLHCVSVLQTGVLPCVGIFRCGTTASSRPGPPRSWGFANTLRDTTLSRTPLDEWSARRGDLCLTTHDTHKRQTYMLPAEFESAIPVSERLNTHALDRATTGIGPCVGAVHTNKNRQKSGTYRWAKVIRLKSQILWQRWVIKWT